MIASGAGGPDRVVTAADWERIAALPVDQQAEALRRAVEAARADPTGGRSEIDEQTREMADQGQGDRHQEEETR